MANDQPSPPMHSPPERLANLDLLRCFAIMSVLVFHGVLMWPSRSFEVPTLIGMGHQGVDLFFVLSGWLIGGLYWSECRKFGSVQIPRFMLRRLIRTVPPYLVIVFVAILGAKLIQKEAAPKFDWGYLIFIQNYYHSLPFLQPTWSLCVEEHFYLVMPITMLLFAGPHKRWHNWAFLTIVLIPLAIRNIWPHTELAAPSHRLFEGLFLGVWCSRIRSKTPETWAKLQRAARLLVWPAILLLPAADLLPPDLRERFTPTILAFSYTCILAAIVELPGFRIAKSKIVYTIALWSYSLYLTHSLSINLFNAVIAKRFAAHLLWLTPVYIAAVFIGGGIFYFCVERTSILLRDRFVPRREGVQASAR